MRQLRFSVSRVHRRSALKRGAPKPREPGRLKQAWLNETIVCDVFLLVATAVAAW